MMGVVCWRRRHFVLTLLAVVAALVGGAFIGHTGAKANGAPVRVVLSYMPEFSNWGPTNATGVGEVSMNEGEARLTVTGLPKLSGETYEAWLLNSTTKESVSVGRFNADDSGSGKLDNVMDDAVVDHDYNVLMLTVESSAGPASKPSEKHSIAGYLVHQSSVATLPAQLPRTGGTADANLLIPIGAVLLVAGIALRRFAARSGRL